MTNSDQHPVLSPEEILAEGRGSYYGYKDQLRAAVFLAKRYHSIGKPYNLLVFGPPGTGKSSFPKVLAYELCRSGSPFSFLPVPCATFASRYRPEETRARLEELRIAHIERAAGPMVVMLDEIDSVGTDRAAYPSGSTVVHWTMDMVRWSNKWHGTRVIVANCNYPRALERALLTEFGGCLYLGHPTEEQSRKILEHEEVASAVDVVRRYERLCNDSGGGYTGRSIGKAIEAVKLIFPDEWKTYSTDELAEALYAQNRVIPSETLSEYEQSNSWIMGPAAALLRRMLPGFQKMLEAGTAKEILDSDELEEALEPSMEAP